MTTLKEKAKKYANHTARDFEEELDQRKFASYWDFDLDSNVNKAKLFFIRFAIMLTYVHKTQHPDEIFQSKEIAYSMVFGQKPANMAGRQACRQAGVTTHKRHIT